MTYKGLTVTRRGNRYRITSTELGTLYGTSGTLEGVSQVIAAFYYDEAEKVLAVLEANN